MRTRIVSGALVTMSNRSPGPVQLEVLDGQDESLNLAGLVMYEQALLVAAHDVLLAIRV